jgi:hypothetical protein
MVGAPKFTNAIVAELQIGPDLPMVDKAERLDGFDLDEYLTIDDDVGPISAGDCESVMGEWERLLSFDLKPRAAKIVRQAGGIGAFEEPGAKRSVDLDGAREDGRCDAFNVAAVGLDMRSDGAGFVPDREQANSGVIGTAARFASAILATRKRAESAEPARVPWSPQSIPKYLRYVASRK